MNKVEMFDNLDPISVIMDGVTSDRYVEITGNTVFRDLLSTMCERYYPGLDWHWEDMIQHWPARTLEVAIDQYYIEME